MAVFSRLFRVTPLVAGVWVSRLAFLGSIFLFVDYLNLRKVPMRRALPILFLLITFPSAYILVSAYTESLFLFLALAAFVSVLREKPALAALAAFLAGLTRIHAIALFPALLVYGWCDSASRHRFLRPVLAPLSGLVVSALCISVFYYYIYK
jgi:Gpi18-like mannosyltransferase